MGLKAVSSSDSNMSDVSSIYYAESGSPPGSALEQERINDWRGSIFDDDSNVEVNSLNDPGQNSQGPDDGKHYYL